MTRWIVTGLIVLNVALGIGVYLRLAGDRPAYGQIGAAGRDMVAVAGYSGADSIVYVLEPGTGRLVALRTSILDKRVTVAATRNITQDLARTR